MVKTLKKKCGKNLIYMNMIDFTKPNWPLTLWINLLNWPDFKVNLHISDSVFSIFYTSVDMNFRLRED